MKNCKLVTFAIVLFLNLTPRFAVALDAADHECRVVTRYAGYTTGGWAGFNFNVDVDQEILAKHFGARVFVRFNLNNKGWQNLELKQSESGSNDFVRFSGSFAHNGHSAMGLTVVSYVEHEGNLLFDHNFESANKGFLSLNRSNNWQIISPACR